MAKIAEKQKQVKTIPNAKRKLTIMIICIVLMLFSITQVYYLVRYTLGLEVSSKNMAVYDWVQKLVSYVENTQEDIENGQAE